MPNDVCACVCAHVCMYVYVSRSLSVCILILLLSTVKNQRLFIFTKIKYIGIYALSSIRFSHSEHIMSGNFGSWVTFIRTGMQWIYAKAKTKIPTTLWSDLFLFFQSFSPISVFELSFFILLHSRCMHECVQNFFHSSFAFFPNWFHSQGAECKKLNIVYNKVTSRCRAWYQFSFSRNRNNQMCPLKLKLKLIKDETWYRSAKSNRFRGFLYWPLITISYLISILINQLINKSIMQIDMWCTFASCVNKLI